MEYNYLGFNIDIGRTKPENIVHRDAACPFCDVASLTNIIDVQDDMILLENKYQVLQDAYQLLIIEGSQCDADIPDYSLEHMCALMRFSLKHWLKVIDSKNTRRCCSLKITDRSRAERCAIRICRLSD